VIFVEENGEGPGVRLRKQAGHASNWNSRVYAATAAPGTLRTTRPCTLGVAASAGRQAEEDREMITPAQCKAARELLGWSQPRLAARADNISETTTRNFEDGHQPTDQKIAAIQRALEAAGVEFTNGDEPGVKLKAKE
jgi:ribosome-binding protein aMBF1 (putative translation factor)